MLDDDLEIDLESIKNLYFEDQPQCTREKQLQTMKEIRDHLQKVYEKCDEQLETLAEIENSCISLV